MGTIDNPRNIATSTSKQHGALSGTHSMPKRVLCFESSPGFGGAGVSLARLISHADAERYRFNVVVSHPLLTEYFTSHAPVESVVVESLNLYSRDAGLGRALAASIGTVGGFGHKATSGLIAGLNWLGPVRSLAHRVRRAFAHTRFDAVWLNNGVTNTFGAASLLARRWRVPLVCKVQGFHNLSPSTRWLAHQIDLFLPDSSAVAQRLLAMGVSQDLIHVTYCPVDVSEFDPTHVVPTGEFRRSRSQGNLLSFGIIGQLLEWKGQHVFLEAAQKILATRGDCLAVVVGSEPDRSGIRLGYLQRYAERLGIKDRVRFVGHREDMAQVMSELDVVVHGSIQPEPFGTVIAEAMAMQRAVVATRAGGPVEYVQDGVNGLLAAPGDAQEMAAAISRLLNSAVLRQQVGQRGRQTVLERFSANKHAVDTQNVLDCVIASHR